MNREKAFCVLPFSCWTFGEPLNLGKVGRADWKMIAHPDTVQILRSDSSGRVKFDVVLVCYSYGNASREFKSTEYLNNGEAYMFFSFGGALPFYAGSGYQGNIRVYFNPWSTVDEGPSTSAIDPLVEKRLPQASNDLLHLLDNSDSFSDAKLKCGDLVMKVHKCILSARSPVFESMFKNEMQDGVLNIVDLEPNVLQAMVRQVYIGKNDKLTESMAEELLFGAVKYQCEGLRLACIERLKASMTLKNIFHYLVLGDTHDPDLKDMAIDFLCTSVKFSELEKDEEWKKFKKERPIMAMDVLTCIVKYVQEKWCRPAEHITLDQDAWFVDPVVEILEGALLA